MKTYFFIITLLFASLFSACSKEKRFCAKNPVVIFNPGKMDTGMAEAEKNCQPFMATCYAGYAPDTSYHAFLGIEFNTFFLYQDLGEDIWLNREVYAVSYIPVQKGYYKLFHATDLSDKRSSECYRVESDGDVLSSIYELDESAGESYLIIDEIDTLNRKVKGRFDIHYKRVRPKPGESEEDPLELQLTSGTFEANISD